jgi:hypothetical protein
VWFVLASGDDDSPSSATTVPVTTVPVTVPPVLSSLAELTVPTIPEITVPEITVPEITVPEITVPEVTLPQIRVPRDITVPTIPNITVPTNEPPGAVNLFTGTQAGAMVADVAAARGADPLRILQVVIYPTYAFAQVQDPNQPTYVDEFPWRDGRVGTSQPVRLFGDGDLESNLFSSTEVAWDAIPAAIATAAEQAAIPDGEITHVIVERDLPFKPDIVVRVYVNSPRESAYVEFDSQGNVLEVVK